tara:strand:+ start:39 stop:596 length:558 start_codon:yes stop_codon:yes gene_type:complete
MNIKELSKKYNLTKEDYWQESRSKKWIITHDACQKIGDMEGIIFGPPQVLNSEQNFVRMVISAKKGEVLMWSIGEADTKNCKNLYFGAMAEKRGKDRVILKLINAYEYGIYSDVEADSFQKPQYEHRTNEQAQEFNDLKGHPAFEGLKKFSNDEWKKCNSVKEYEDVLVRMRSERDKFDEINESN